MLQRRAVRGDLRGCAPVDVRPLDWESDAVMSDEAPDVILAADVTVFVRLRAPHLDPRGAHLLAVPATEVYIMHQATATGHAQFLLDEFGRRFEVEERGDSSRDLGAAPPLSAATPSTERGGSGIRCA